MKRIEYHKLNHDVLQKGGFELEHMPQVFDKYAPDACYAPHSHNFYEIIWFQEDGGTHTVDMAQYPVQANSFFFIAPGQMHQFDHSNTRGIIFKFVPEFLNDESSTKDICFRYHFFNSFDICPYHVISDESNLQYIRSIQMGVEGEMERQDSFGHLRFMQSLVELLLIIFERCCNTDTEVQKEEQWQRPPLNITNTQHSHFIRFRQMLEKEYRTIHNVKDYASLLGVGTKYLTTIVKECTNRTPLQLINDRILLEAKRQLKYSNKMVKEIAYDLGYDDPSYFVKQFKRQMGMLPTDFRSQ